MKCRSLRRTRTSKGLFPWVTGMEMHRDPSSRRPAGSSRGYRSCEFSFPTQLREAADCCTSLHDHNSNHSEFHKANARMNFSSNFIKDIFSPSLRLICQHSLASQGNIPNLLQPANSHSVPLFPAAEEDGQAWILTHNILKLSAVCP